MEQLLCTSKPKMEPRQTKWPENGDDPCGPPSWPYVFCFGGRVTQIQAKNLGLKGSLPPNFNQLSELQNLGLLRNNLSGMLPTFSGLSKLQFAFLDYNEFDAIPSDFFNGLTSIRVLWLNDQDGGEGGGMTGPIDVIASMTYLRRELNLNGNQLVGLIPNTLANMDLEILVLNNNRFMGPIPKFKATQVSYDSNLFCRSKPRLECAPEVTVLLDFLHNLDYPLFLTTKWSGNEPCGEPWFGLNCNHNSEVSIVNFPRQKLNGKLSPSLAKLDSLIEIRLAGNNIIGNVPNNLGQYSQQTVYYFQSFEELHT
ncbi:Leucine-rich repeat domain superfamily [Sesbania bispinosa]|nr:Leucine-rich repeat domain superfamily [Sesbania bispinosa]